MDAQLLEITLISAQGLKTPSTPLRRTHTYAVAWLDPAAKLRTRIDRVGDRNPTWNDKFIFRVPASSLLPDSPSAVSVEIHADGGWILPDSLIGTVRLLLGNLHLLDRPRDAPSFVAVGIRRPSGRFHGVLNVGATLLSHVSVSTSEKLVGSSAVGYKELMGEGSRVVRSRAALKERNGEVGEERSDGVGALCGLGLQPKIHLSPSDQNLQISWSNERKS